jgi:flagellar biosynthesis protein FlhF
MKMKQITATDMADAMKIAKAELGEDAVLIDTKKVVGSKGITVTFAVEEDDDFGFDDIFSDDAEGEIGGFGEPSIARATSARAEIDHPAYAIVREVLQHHHVPDHLHERLMRRLRQVEFIPGALADVAEAALAEILHAELAFMPVATGAGKAPARAIMLVGTHGAGKTSTIAKFATELTLNKQRVVIISCDNERMGATDTLAGLCGLLKCEFHVAQDRAAIKPLLKEYEGKAWILIDSAGINIYEFQQLKALGEIASLSAVEPILTCPAGMDAAEAAEMAAALDFLSIERMIATKLDATRHLSSLFAAIGSGGLALANISSSAKPTQACNPASPAALARLMLRHVRERIS